MTTYEGNKHRENKKEKTKTALLSFCKEATGRLSHDKINGNKHREKKRGKTKEAHKSKKKHRITNTETDR
jgi:hypothetical protein